MSAVKSVSLYMHACSMVVKWGACMQHSRTHQPSSDSPLTERSSTRNGAITPAMGATVLVHRMTPSGWTPSLYWTNPSVADQMVCSVYVRSLSPYFSRVITSHLLVLRSKFLVRIRCNLANVSQLWLPLTCPLSKCKTNALIKRSLSET